MNTELEQVYTVHHINAICQSSKYDVDSELMIIFGIMALIDDFDKTVLLEW